MPVNYTYPGVYVEEIPSGVRTIVGVSTSDTAFIDFFLRGPMNAAYRCTSLADFERTFGGLDPRSPASYAIQQYFLNDGQIAWVIRVSPRDIAGNVSAKKASFNLSGGSSGTGLILASTNEGVWGNAVRLAFVTATTGTTVLAIPGPGTTIRPGAPTTPTVTLTPATGSATTPTLSLSGWAPAANATVTIRIYAGETIGGSLVQTLLPVAGAISAYSSTVTPALPPGSYTAQAIQTDGAGAAQASAPITFTVPSPLSNTVAQELITFTVPSPRFNIVAQELLARDGVPVRDTRGRVTVLKTETYRNLSMNSSDRRFITGVLAAESSLIAVDSIGAGGVPQTGPADANGNVPDVAWQPLSNGLDGNPADAGALQGNPADFSGIYALDRIAPAIFNILCIPAAAGLDPAGRDSPNLSAVLTAAQDYCTRKRAFLIVDVPQHLSLQGNFPVLGWVNQNITPSPNAAVYFPRLEIRDPLRDNQPINVPASGTLAGVFARTDASRGVWKTPAGIEARLVGATPVVRMTDDENGALNPFGINALRFFPIFGNISWGGRTTVGADQQASEWKYVAVRRTALYIEESLSQGLRWVVFEPNDEPLWSQIRLNVGAFMQNLFRQGAFQGHTPREAYFVKCDGDTTTQYDIDRGVVNIVVGFAPLKPAEFVVIKLQQMTADSER